MSKFRNIPGPPASKAVEDLDWFEKVKYNLEILMGQRQEDAAVLRSDIKLLRTPDPRLRSIKRGQEGVGILSASTIPAAGNVTVPTMDDYKQLQEDVDLLRADNTVLRTYLNSLILQLKAREE
jgi:hypothetical protein